MSFGGRHFTFGGAASSHRSPGRWGGLRPCPGVGGDAGAVPVGLDVIEQGRAAGAPTGPHVAGRGLRGVEVHVRVEQGGQQAS